MNADTVQYPHGDACPRCLGLIRNHLYGALRPRDAGCTLLLSSFCVMAAAFVLFDLLSGPSRLQVSIIKRRDGPECMSTFDLYVLMGIMEIKGGVEKEERGGLLPQVDRRGKM